MPSNLRKLYETLHCKYKLLPDVVKYLCFYCGLPADTLDHVPSLYRAYCLGTDAIEAQKIDLYLVPACRECNSILGARESFCPLERRDLVHQLLRKRYRKILGLPEWTDEEMEDLGPMMKSEIEQSMNLKILLLRRVSYGR